MDFSQEEFDEILSIFSAESDEMVNHLNSSLLVLEKQPDNKDLIIELFRGAHSLKGAARMIGFNDIQAMVHKVEDILGLAKNDKLKIDPNITDVLCKTIDFINLHIQLSIKAKKEIQLDDYQKYMQMLENLTNNFEITILPKPQSEEVSNDKVIEEKKTLAEETVIENKASFSGFNANEIIENVFKLEKDTSIVDDIINNIQKINEKYENTPIKAVFEKIENILNTVKNQKVTPDKEMLNILRQSILLSDKIINDANLAEKEDLELLLQSLDITQQMIGLRTNQGFQDTSLPYIQKSSDIQENAINIQGQDVFQVFENTTIKTLRVDTNKLDKLVNQIGEVIVSKIKMKKNILELEDINNRLTELHDFSLKAHNYLKYYDRKITQLDGNADVNNYSNFNKQILSYIAESQSKLVDEIHEIYNLHKKMQEDDTKLTQVVNQLEQMVKDIRLLPLATVFHMIPRMVRDIAKEKGKEIELNISGSETNADKKIIEEIKTPLVHIIRNAIDHGIETPAERTAVGKPPSGKINLSAQHKDNKIVIEVLDDGRGVDLEKIKKKAISSGLLSNEEIKNMTDEQIMNLIFWPGFTTEETVTDISGRGIGLDVVQTRISRLNGKVKVQSIISHGTKVTIELPVTMATIKAFIVRLNTQYFALPVSLIKSVITVKNDDIYQKDGKDNILYQQKSVPIYDLRTILGFEKYNIQNDKKTILLIEAENNSIGLVVEELVGGQEILNKEFAPPLFKIKNVSGVTTLVNGEICLIVNVSELLKSIISHEVKHVSAIKEAVLTSKVYNPSDYKILVVDDFMTTRIMLKNILTAKNYNVEIANDALEALEKLDCENYDIVVSDIEMPKMDGYELTKTIKSSDLKSKMPVILISSLSGEEDLQKGKAAGANAFVDKNKFNQEYFLNLIKTLISEKSVD